MPINSILKLPLSGKPRHDHGPELSSAPPGEELQTFETTGSGIQRWSQESLNDGDDTTDPGTRFVRRIGKEVPVEETDEMEFELSKKVVDLETLQDIVSRGHLDDRLRPVVWKLLLGYLPTDRDAWEGELAANRSRYAQLKQEILVNPSELLGNEDEMLFSDNKERKNDVDGPLSRQMISNGDHPLNLSDFSIWGQYFKDAEITEQIDRDLRRTHPDVNFFSEECSLSQKNREAMRNILLLFAKINPEIRYVQGMNEVLAPLYYIFSTDSDEETASNAEADSFGCFLRLMGDSVDHFCEQLDNSSGGIHSSLSHLSELLKTNDEELWQHLEISKVDMQFYAFRWITLLLTQEFEFHSVMRIWDSLISSPLGIQEMLLRVCCAMLICVRGDLLEGDFASNLKLLQHYPRIDLDYLIGIAKELASV